MTQVTLDNLHEFGIGNKFSDRIYPQDIQYITYGITSDASVVTEDPTDPNGSQAWWKEPSFNRWWKVGPRGFTGE